MIAPAHFAVMGVSAYLYLPVFYNLQLTSTYEVHTVNQFIYYTSGPWKFEKIGHPLHIL